MKSRDELEVKEFEIICEPQLLDSIYENYKEDIYIPIQFVTKGDTVSAKMRLRGDTSREYNKKSLKIVFAKQHVPEGEKAKINLNSEWTDQSYIRQYLSSELMRQAGIVAYHSNFVKLYLNGEFWGLYLQVENMDKSFAERNNLSSKGNLYKATKDGACLSHFDDIHVKWEKKLNKKEAWDDLQTLINELDTVSVDNYKNYLEQTFEYDKLISIIAMHMLVQHGSTYYHNYYLYHDINGTGKWQMFPWDMDKTLSYYNWKPYKYHETSSNWESDNPLIEKSFLNDEVFADIEAKVRKLGKTIFTNRNIDPIIEQCKSGLKEWVSKDKTDQIENASDWSKALDKEKEFVGKQVDNLLHQFANLPSSFLLEKVEQEQSKNITLKWSPSKSAKPIKYKLLYGKHFLLKDSTTKIIDNIADTRCHLTELEPGKYYWRVYASDGENVVEAFNTKSTFTILAGKTSYVNSDTVLLKKNSPHYINNTWFIKNGVSLTVEAGCKVLLAENGSIINHGNIYAVGSKDDSIEFLPQAEIWDNIYSYNKQSILRFEYCNFQDGYFRSKESNVEFLNCTYTLKNKKLYTNGIRSAMIWVHKGKFSMQNCYVKNYQISDGEGLNINYAEAIVKNSVFVQLADAIEFINISSGEIVGNIVMDSPDDAIDMNGCTNILIRDNILINNNDKAISVGTEQYGPSKNILIENNLLLGNNIGVSIKDSSVCSIKNTSFVKNNLAIEARLKNNWKHYTVGGNLKAVDCVFYENKRTVQCDKNSIVEIASSLSEKAAIEGIDNHVMSIIFENSEVLNYNTNTGKGIFLSHELLDRYSQLK